LSLALSSGNEDERVQEGTQGEAVQTGAAEVYTTNVRRMVEANPSNT